MVCNYLFDGNAQCLIVNRILRYQIDKFKTFIIELIDNKLKHIESNINYIRDYNFRRNYTDYHKISEHINLINDISNNIKVWEESYGKYI